MLDRRTLLKVSAKAGLLAVFLSFTLTDEVKKADAYIALVDHYEFDKNAVIAWARNSFKAAFLSTEKKQSYLDEFETWVKTNT